MVARSCDRSEVAVSGRDFALNPQPQSPHTQCPNGEFGLSRLGELLPQVLEQYGVDGRTLDAYAETNRPGIALSRRRVG